MNWVNNNFDIRNKKKLEKIKRLIYMNKMLEWKKQVEASGQCIYDMNDKNAIKSTVDYQRLKTIINSSLRLQVDNFKESTNKNFKFKKSEIKKDKSNNNLKEISSLSFKNTPSSYSNENLALYSNENLALYSNETPTSYSKETSNLYSKETSFKNSEETPSEVLKDTLFTSFKDTSYKNLKLTPYNNLKVTPYKKLKKTLASSSNEIRFKSPNINFTENFSLISQNSSKVTSSTDIKKEKFF